MSYGRRVPDGPEVLGMTVVIVGALTACAGLGFLAVWGSPPSVALVVIGIVLVMVGGIIGSA